MSGETVATAVLVATGAIEASGYTTGGSDTGCAEVSGTVGGKTGVEVAVVSVIKFRF